MIHAITNDWVDIFLPSPPAQPVVEANIHPCVGRCCLMVRLSREVGQTRSVLYEENRQRYLSASISFLSHFDISHCGKSAVIQH